MLDIGNVGGGATMTGVYLVVCVRCPCTLHRPQSHKAPTTHMLFLIFGFSLPLRALFLIKNQKQHFFAFQTRLKTHPRFWIFARSKNAKTKIFVFAFLIFGFSLPLRLEGKICPHPIIVSSSYSHTKQQKHGKSSLLILDLESVNRRTSVAHNSSLLRRYYCDHFPLLQGS